MPYLADALMKGGADEQVIAEFCCLADSTAIDGSPRYHFTRHLEWLSDMIVGTTTGPNKDMPLFELCHLVLMVDAVWKGQEGRWMAFLGLDKPRPQAYREWFHERVEVLVEETLTIQMSKDAVALDLGGTSFEITFARMPRLAALYEFLVTMDNGEKHEILEEVFNCLCSNKISDASIKRASNAIATLLRDYRAQHLERAIHERQFRSLFGFLRSYRTGEHLIIDDEAVLEFWLSDQKDGFSRFATVVDAFVTLHRHMASVSVAKSISAAVPIGTSHEDGEHDIVVSDEAAISGEVWHSPLDELDKWPADKINFLKSSSEKQPINNLSKYGPEAILLPRSMLRLESFSPIQALITNNLRRDHRPTSNMLLCDGAVPYHEIVTTINDVAEHISKLQLAILWALNWADRYQESLPDNVVKFPGMGNEKPQAAYHWTDDDDVKIDLVLENARVAFDNLKRKGFSVAFLDDESHVEGMRIGGDALIRIQKIINKFNKYVSHRAKELESDFKHDCHVFSSRFHELYGAG